MRPLVSRDGGDASANDASTKTITKRRPRGLKFVPALFVVVALGVALTGAFAQVASAETGVPCPQTGMETVATDELDYAPGSTVHVTGTGYAPACDATVQISRPDTVVESFTATTDFAGNLEYDYLLPPPPGVIGEYGLDILGLSGVLASMTFTDAGPKLDRIWSDAALTNEDYLFAVGDTVYVKAITLSATRGYKFEAKNAAGVSQYLGPCKTGATTASDSYAPATLSGATDWTWVLHEWSTNNCTTGPQSEDADNTLGFNVASATTYANSTLTTQQTTFAASTPLTGTVAKTSGGANTTLTGTGTSFLTQLAIGDTIAVPHAGGTDFRRVTAIATNTSLTVNLAWSTSATGQTATKSRQVYVTVAGLEQGENDYSTTWVLPGGGTSCANTSGGGNDRANSTATGDLPDTAPAYLEYVPSDSANNWNRQSNYDAPNCALFSASNQGTWKLTLARDSTHTATFNIFSVDAAAPTVTINQAPSPGRADERLADPLHGHLQRGRHRLHGR